MEAALEHDSYPIDDREIPSAVGHAVRAPLAALRASMEALVQEYQEEDPRSFAVRGALDEVVRMGHEMQTLLDYALPLPLQTSSCSLREIVRSALSSVGPSRRSDVWTAIEDPRDRIEVDGTLLARAIARLFETGPGSHSAPALLRARTDGADAVLTLVLGPADRRRNRDADLQATSAASVLGIVLARREVERMGGRFSFRRAEANCLLVEIRFPGSIARKNAA